MTFKIIETQEELDRIIQERLNREKEKFSDYDAIKTRNAELENEIGTLKSTIEETNAATKTHEQTVADLNKKIAEYETASLRTRIALQNGLEAIGELEANPLALSKVVIMLLGKKQTEALKDHLLLNLLRIN